MLQIIESLEGKQKYYRFAEGHWKERGYPVTSGNLSIAVGLQSGKLSKKGEDMTLDDILQVLKDNRRVLDSSYTIRYVVGEPLMNVRCGFIGSIVLMHLEACETGNVNPEMSPIHLMQTPEMKQGVAMKMNQRMMAVPDVEMGSINMFNANQVVFSYHEWHLVPASERILFVKKNLQVTPTFAKSIKDLCINGMVVVDDGRLISDKTSNLWILNMEIDKVIKDVNLDGFPPTKLDKPDDDRPMEGAGA